MSDTNEMFQQIGTGVLQIVKQAAGQYATEATKDAQAFLDGAKAQVAEWLQQLNDGKMERDQFEFIAVGRLKDLAAMDALTQVGIAAATLDAVRSKIASCVVTAISTRIP